jgi:predicted ArsR family transcriptional regulator
VQTKRRDIVDILKRLGAATVEELRKELDITSVTVRHHLDVLRSEGLVADPVVRHSNRSGRPQHTYSLTHKAEALFPHNYNGLAEALLEEIKVRCDPDQVDRILEGVAARLASEAPRLVPGERTEVGLGKTVEFLNELGYVAHWERRDEDYLITTCNCPFDNLVEAHPDLCQMDLHLMTTLVGAPVERVCHRVEGDTTCAYVLKTG